MRALLQLLLTALLCGALFAAVDNRAVADAAAAVLDRIGLDTAPWAPTFSLRRPPAAR